MLNARYSLTLEGACFHERFKKNIGMLFLAIWLIAWGLIKPIPTFSGLGLVLAVLAIAAGIFILLDR